MAVAWLPNVQTVISSCPAPSTNSTPAAPSVASPSWLSNKAMGHISEAFRGSLAHPLVSANHSCNWEPNPFRDFNQTQTAGSSRSWGRMIQLPQRHQAKIAWLCLSSSYNWKVKHLWQRNDTGNLLRSQCERTVCEKWSAIFPFRGQNVVFPSIFQVLSKTQFLILRVVTETLGCVRSFGLTGSRHLGLTADREDGRPPGNGLTGRYLQPDISSHLRKDESAARLSAEKEKFLARSLEQKAYRRIWPTWIMGK